MNSTRGNLASRRDVAEFLGVSVHTLARWACLGTGPSYARIGARARYEWSDVERWLEQQRVTAGEQR